jgi:hypothetical protein
MRRDDEGKPAIRRHCAKQLLQRLEPARQGANPDDWTPRKTPAGAYAGGCRSTA